MVRELENFFTEIIVIETQAMLVGSILEAYRESCKSFLNFYHE